MIWDSVASRREMGTLTLPMYAEPFAASECDSSIGRTDDDTELPDAFVTTADLSPHNHLVMQAALQATV